LKEVKGRSEKRKRVMRKTGRKESGRGENALKNGKGWKVLQKKDKKGQRRGGRKSSSSG